jgi:hypothetical protein
VGGVGESFRAQRIEGRNDGCNHIGICMGLRVQVKPLKVLRFTSLLQDFSGKVWETQNLTSFS